MVSSLKLVYDFIRKHNSNDTGKNRDLPIHSIIAYLNEALLVWYRNRVAVAQTDSRVRNELRYFKNDLVSLELSKIDDNAYLAKYPADLFHRLNQIAVVTKSCCNKPKKIIPRIIESDDLYEALNNPYRKPDFFYEQLIAIESTNGLIIYTDEDMVIDSVKIDYYKTPQEIHAPSSDLCAKMYYLYNGVTITKDQHFEGEDISATDIVDIAVLLANVDSNDPRSYETRLNSILGKQQIHKQVS